MSRITCSALSSKVITADAAAVHIGHGDRVAMSGFTSLGYPKSVPGAIAAQARTKHDQGRDFAVAVDRCLRRPRRTRRYPRRGGSCE